MSTEFSESITGLLFQICKWNTGGQVNIQYHADLDALCLRWTGFRNGTPYHWEGWVQQFTAKEAKVRDMHLTFLLRSVPGRIAEFTRTQGEE